MPQFSLIVLSYKSAPHIERCLKALAAQDGDFEIILADNGSGDADYGAIAAQYDGVRFIQNGDNLGFAKGNNQAAQHAKGDWLGFINPDAFVDADWLSAMRSATERNPDISIFTSLQLDAANPNRLDGVGDGMSLFGFPYRMGYGHQRPSDLADSLVFSPCGAAFVIKRSLFEALGGFEESFFCYCEDADLGFRAQLSGQSTVFVADAIMHHIGSASLGVRSDFAILHGYRNRLWLYGRNMPLLALLLTLPFHIVITLIYLLKDVLGGKGAVAVCGLVDGLKGLPSVMTYRQKHHKYARQNRLNTLRSMTFDPIRALRRAIDHRPPQV